MVTDQMHGSSLWYSISRCIPVITVTSVRESVLVLLMLVRSSITRMYHTSLRECPTGGYLGRPQSFAVVKSAAVNYLRPIASVACRDQILESLSVFLHLFGGRGHRP